MPKQRTDRLNSLLKEVLSEVIRRDLKHKSVSDLLTVTRVDISKDLRHAKVFISVIGTDQVKAETLAALQSAAGFIAHAASKKVVLRYFPSLTFHADEGLDNQMRVHELLTKISEERKERTHDSEPTA